MTQLSRGCECRKQFEGLKKRCRNEKRVVVVLLVYRWDGPNAVQTLEPHRVNKRRPGCGFSLTDLCARVIVAVQSSSSLCGVCYTTGEPPRLLLNISSHN